MSVFNLPPVSNGPVGQVHPPLQSVTRFKALRIYCCNPEGGGNPRADRLRMDLFGDELHAGSVYTEREIMIIGEECERTLEWLVGDQGLNETGAERGRANTLWYHLKWMQRERDRLIASRIARSLADGEKGDKSVKVSFGSCARPRRTGLTTTDGSCNAPATYSISAMPTATTLISALCRSGSRTRPMPWLTGTAWR